MSEKISAMPAAGALTGTELVPLVQGGVNVQSTTQDIADLGGGGGGAKIAYVRFADDGTFTFSQGIASVTLITVDPNGDLFVYAIVYTAAYFSVEPVVVCTPVVPTGNGAIVWRILTSSVLGANIQAREANTGDGSQFGFHVHAIGTG